MTFTTTRTDVIVESTQRRLAQQLKPDIFILNYQNLTSAFLNKSVKLSMLQAYDCVLCHIGIEFLSQYNIEILPQYDTRWLHCVECPQYSIRLEALGYLCTSCLLPARVT